MDKFWTAPQLSDRTPRANREGHGKNKARRGNGETGQMESQATAQRDGTQRTRVPSLSVHSIPLASWAMVLPERACERWMDSTVGGGRELAICKGGR